MIYIQVPWYSEGNHLVYLKSSNYSAPFNWCIFFPLKLSSVCADFHIQYFLLRHSVSYNFIKAFKYWLFKSVEVCVCDWTSACHHSCSAVTGTLNCPVCSGSEADPCELWELAAHPGYTRNSEVHHT